MRLTSTRPQLFFVSLALLFGCSQGPRVYPVSGRVVHPNGEPVAAGMVEFESIDHRPKINARGAIQPDGTFRLGTFSEDDGAVAGRHRAVVLPPVRAIGHDAGPATFDLRYASYMRSGLEFTVAEGPNELTIEVERHK